MTNGLRGTTVLVARKSAYLLPPGISGQQSYPKQFRTYTCKSDSLNRLLFDRHLATIENGSLRSSAFLLQRFPSSTVSPFHDLPSETRFFESRIDQVRDSKRIAGRKRLIARVAEEHGRQCRWRCGKQALAGFPTESVHKRLIRANR